MTRVWLTEAAPPPERVALMLLEAAGIRREREGQATVSTTCPALVLDEGREPPPQPASKLQAAIPRIIDREICCFMVLILLLNGSTDAA
jgi:hypothetical protein